MSEIMERIKVLPERERLLALIKDGDCRDVSQALDAGFSVEVADDQGITPLMAACIFHPTEPELIKLLLAAKADVSAVCRHQSMTALGYACANNANGEVVGLLVDAGVDLDDTMPDGKTALHLAAIGNVHEEVLSLLIAHGMDPAGTDQEEWNCLHLAAARNGNPAIAGLLARAGLDLECRVPDGRTALALAVSCNHLPMIQGLLDLGADLRTRTPEGITLLMLAALFDPRPETSRFLLDRGLGVDERDHEGMTALHYAASRLPNPDVMGTLLAAGAGLDGPSNKGFTPLMRASAENPQVEIAAWLLEAGAAVNSVDVLGYTALHHALQADRELAMINLLLENGADPLHRTLAGESIVLQAAATGTRPEVLDRLLDAAGPDMVNQPNAQGIVPLAFAAVRENGLPVVAFLLAEGADPNLADGKGHTPLMHAVARATCLEAIDALLDAGADATRMDARGWTAWDHATGVQALWYTPQKQRLKAFAPPDGRWVPAHVKPGRSAPPMLDVPREPMRISKAWMIGVGLFVLLALIGALTGAR